MEYFYVLFLISNLFLFSFLLNLNWVLINTKNSIFVLVKIWLTTYLLYLIGHNNPINGFRPAATHPSNRWQGFLDLVFPTDARSSFSPTSADPRIKYPSCRIILLHTNDMARPAQPLDINTLHNVHVVEELIQLTTVSNAEIIANSHWTEDIT